MAYDGLVNYSVVSELQTKIINGKIDKIFEPNFEEIVLGIYSNGVKYALSFVTNSKYYRASLTTNSKPNPTFAPNFCMTLRKYMLGTHITNIYTNGLERIIFIEFEGFNKSKDFSTKKLVVELMGKHSNIILVDSNNIIIDSLKHFSIDSGSYRNIYSGEKYELPKSDKLDFTEVSDENEFYRVLEVRSAKFQITSLASLISNTFTGISKNSIVAFEKVLNISDEFGIEASNQIYKYIIFALNNTNKMKCSQDGSNYYLAPCDDKNNDLQINFFLDDYYTQKENSSNFVTYRNNLLKLILTKLNKLNSKLDVINAKIQECKEAEKYKLYGELITSNLYRIKDYNTDSIVLENYYDENKPIEIKLDPSITPSANAKKFFRKYKKLKNAQEYVDMQKASLVSDIDYLESIVYEIDKAKTIIDIDEIYSELQESAVTLKNNRFSKSYNATNPSSKLDKSYNASNSSAKFNKTNNLLNPKLNNNNKKIIGGKNKSKKDAEVGEPLRFEVDGFTVLVGKNNRQNDYLTTKLANKEDIWLHVKDAHGSHVILRTENKTPSQDTINKCAKLAKEHSKSTNSSNVPVDYTLVKYVKKPSGSKPGMVIYTNNKSVNV